MRKTNAIAKNLHLCFTKIKPPEEESRGSITTQISSDDPLLIKNYNSLYRLSSKSPPRSSSSVSASSSSSTSSADGPEPDFATAIASHRFFFSSPGRSNSIIESTPTSAATSSKSSDAPPMSMNDNAVPSSKTNRSLLVDGCESQSPRSQNSDRMAKDSSSTIAVPTYSPDPYQDFRRSMQEMVEARNLLDVKANWDYLHELLLCYLALNPKSNHKFIVRAFADLLVSLLSSQPENAGRRESSREISRRSM